MKALVGSHAAESKTHRNHPYVTKFQIKIDEICKELLEKRR